jgi:hypothetical protein
MAIMDHHTEDSTLKSVQKQLEVWRSGKANKREPIPQHLWQAAAGLCKEYSIAQVSRELRLSYTDLKKRILQDNSSTARFVEIDTTIFGSKWQIECERSDGSRLRMTGNSQPPQIESLLRSFLS